MKIGLVRHFKVKIALPKKLFITRDELLAWFDEYDRADIECGKVDLGNVSWKSCYSSDLPRTIKTAESIYDGDIISLQGLRELNPLRFFNRNYKLPLWMWMILSRIKQLFSKRSTIDFQKQIASCLNEILSKYDEDILIVSHGFAMIFLQKELKKRGYKGVGFNHPANGRLYIFETS